MPERYDIIVIGAGIVGLATAYQILQQKKEVRLAVLEKESEVSRHQSGHNSGVIHSGIYYKPGSLKAQNCLRGYQQMVEFCKTHSIPFDLCGKVIVATKKEEIPALNEIYNRGIANGLNGLQYLDEGQIREKEPHTQGVLGLFVPQTGIIDYTVVCKKLGELISNMGGSILLDHKVTAVREEHDQLFIESSRGHYQSDYLINCAGLQSDEITRMVIGQSRVKIIPFRGEYYVLKEEKASLVKNLIYPVPNPEFPFLGVHFTRMINGGVEAGPNAVLAFKKEGYRKTDFSLSDLMTYAGFSGFWKIIRKFWRTGMGEMYRSISKKAFTKSLQMLIPEITSDDLLPGGSGVRAQACDKEGNLIDDFYFEYSSRSLHVCNAPSPAATSCLAIGETIVKKMQENYSL